MNYCKSDSSKQTWPWGIDVSPSIYKNFNNWPKISIITPSYNQGNFIEETIRSILMQNYPNLEFIIIDGESVDNTKDIIYKYIDNINVYISERDGGQSSALVKGFNLATGEILNWINSDDILNRFALYSIAIEFIKDKRIDFIHGQNLIINKYSNLVGKMPHLNDNLMSRYLCEMPYGQQSCFFSSKIYKMIGGINYQLKFSMDFELYVKIHLNTIFSTRFDAIIGSYREHSDTKTYNLSRTMYNENMIIFINVLFSLNSEFLKIFLKMGYVPNDKYNVGRKITRQQLRKATIYFLKKNIWHYYEIKELKIASLMAINLIRLKPNYIINKQYLKIIKDGNKIF